jgi:hypothetical protein
MASQHENQTDESNERETAETQNVNSSKVDGDNKGDAADASAEQKILTETPDEPAESDEDIADFSIFCDGGCGKRIESWTMPFYLCLICPNADLCEDCHSKRLAWNRGEGEDAWKSYCGKNHHYIKGPMKDWRGIKNGVIRIGDQEFGVKDWIKELKEERWPKAWEEFWLQQGGLKDIDVED